MMVLPVASKLCCNKENLIPHIMYFKEAINIAALDVLSAYMLPEIFSLKIQGLAESYKPVNDRCLAERVLLIENTGVNELECLCNTFVTLNHAVM